MIPSNPEPYCPPDYPLGPPINRKPEPGLVRVPGRPNWWRDQRGVDRYIEPSVVPGVPVPSAPIRCCSG